MITEQKHYYIGDCLCMCRDCGEPKMHGNHTPTGEHPVHFFLGVSTENFCTVCGQTFEEGKHMAGTERSPWAEDMPCNPMCFRNKTTRMEHHHIRCDKFDPNGSQKEHISEEAMRIVYGDREKAYDNPNRNFNKLAHMWTGTILEKLKPGERITPNDVALMLIQLKVSRESFRPNRENRVDGVGYWECLDRIVTHQEQEEADNLEMMDTTDHDTSE